MKIQFIRVRPTAQLPQRGSKEAAGYDLFSANTEPIHLMPGERALIPIGLQVAIPLGYELQIRPRSGMANNLGVTVLNTPGTIDSDFRGEIHVLLINHGSGSFPVLRAMKIAQCVLKPIFEQEWEEVAELPSTDRGEGGFGSTGQ